jgi:hypothetical protein
MISEEKPGIGIAAAARATGARLDAVSGGGTQEATDRRTGRLAIIFGFAKVNVAEPLP